MFTSILFAIDDDEALPGAVPVVAAYARRWGASVLVAHVKQPGKGWFDGTGRSLVARITRELVAGGVRATGQVRIPPRRESVAAVLARMAAEERADLVVVGSHGRSDLPALVAGSVSHALAAGLDVPVMVVRGTAPSVTGPRTIVLAVDGTPACDEAVAETGDIATAFGAHVIVLHARPLTAAAGWAAVQPEDERAAVLAAVAALESRGVRVTARTRLTASVVDCIVATAERAGADLVVLGSRRPTDVGGLLLGSTAHGVIHRLRRPVLLARRVRARELVG